MKMVDTRGLACPQPVILTRKALQEDGEVTVIVDPGTAQHNVTRMAEKAGHAVSVEQKADGIYIHIGDQDAVSQSEVEQASGRREAGPLVLAVQSEFMGRGEHAELGGILMRSFFHTLGEVEPLPDTILFFNSGVRLVVEGSPVLDDLKALHECGIELIACGTCLGYYNLKDKVAVGEVSNMYAIAETMLRAGKVVNL